ncbi:Protein VACUOLELESS GAMETOPHYTES [Cardamine amara subsp. amara]|uniref:Protein VACUOLELESS GAMETOPHYTES n=1 Tax=Cardamine amara subsp. amara TaxID=228776 RepID=A0ABD1B2E9_CARAN
MDQMNIKRCPDHGCFLESTKKSSKCYACYEDHHDNKQGYKCKMSCNFYVHEECNNANIPSHHKHPLKLITGKESESCFLCKDINVFYEPDVIFYQCSQCSFSICIPCARKPLIFHQSKAHEHQLHQVPIAVSFTCDACGFQSTNYPCICLQCCFMIHRTCIDLPRVIYINRHDHRISRVSSLGSGKWICGICYDPINGEYGAYSCSVCSYVVHSKCATNLNIVWDGRELEGVPEQDEKEESKPFKVIDHNLIKHFRHEHNLKASSSSSRLEEPRERCYACTLPLYSELCYKCTQCGFILHDACANLPLKKRHGIFTTKPTLWDMSQHGTFIESLFCCEPCGRYCTGFLYCDDAISIGIDVRCASISDTFKHESHPHWLFATFYNYEIGKVRCEGCDLDDCRFYLCCMDKDDCGGGYNLCFTCATLPTSVRHEYDDHPLSLCYGAKNVNATYCCGICEEEIYSKSWFYKCDECGSTLHTKCVFRDLIHALPGYSLEMGGQGSFDLLPNNCLSRPICYLCKTRCMGDLVLNNKADSSIFLCCSCGFSPKFLGTSMERMKKAGSWLYNAVISPEIKL